MDDTDVGQEIARIHDQLASEWVKGTCGKPQVKCGECPNQAFIPVSDAVIAQHLGVNKGMGLAARSDVAMGVYPLLPDETCWFLAADFDGAAWSQDALACLETCRLEGVAAALERSRSGNGGHLWIFFGVQRHAGGLPGAPPRPDRPDSSQVLA